MPITIELEKSGQVLSDLKECEESYQVHPSALSKKQAAAGDKKLDLKYLVNFLKYDFFGIFVSILE